MLPKYLGKMIDSIKYFSYILADSAYDTTDIYDYVFENTHALPVIDTKEDGALLLRNYL